MRSLVYGVLAVLTMLFSTSLATAGTYTSNEYTASGGETTANVDVSGTTATDWELQEKTEDGWMTIQQIGNGFQPAGSFDITLNNPFQAGKVYRVIGNTSASGRHGATLTAS